MVKSGPQDYKVFLSPILTELGISLGIGLGLDNYLYLLYTTYFFIAINDGFCFERKRGKGTTHSFQFIIVSKATNCLAIKIIILTNSI